MKIYTLLTTGVLITLGSFLFQSQSEGSVANNTAMVPKFETGYEQGQIYREVQIVINRNADDYFREFLHTPLKYFLPGTDKIAGVKETRTLTRSEFPEIGSMRQVILKDGESAKEQVLELRARYFKYRVSDYTLEQAKPIEYGTGEFWFVPLAENSLLVRWKYSFRLKGNFFPGNLGWLGRRLFKWSFLDRDYAEFMNVGIHAIKAHAEGTGKIR